jgi:hypothetical protein
MQQRSSKGWQGPGDGGQAEEEKLRRRRGGGEALMCWSSGGPSPDGGGEALDRRRPWSRRQMRGAGPTAEERRWSRELYSCRNKSEILGSKHAKLFYPRALFPPSAPLKFPASAPWLMKISRFRAASPASMPPPCRHLRLGARTRFSSAYGAERGGRAPLCASARRSEHRNCA